MTQVIICPRCGFSFNIKITQRKEKIVCPMCGFEFKFPRFEPHY